MRILSIIVLLFVTGSIFGQASISIAKVKSATDITDIWDKEVHKNQIIGFDLSILSNGTLKTFTLYSSAFRKEVIECMALMHAGDKIFLDNIKVEVADGTVRTLHSEIVVTK